MNNITYIYGLIDPRLNMVRYVGKSNRPDVRFKDHLKDITNIQVKTYKAFWLRKLDSMGLVPQLVILEEVNKAQWQERECFWINHYRSAGSLLVNGTNGGDGNNGQMQTAESNLKRSVAHKGKIFPEETCKKISLAKKGKPGKPRSAETRAKISLNNAMKNRPEVRAKSAASRTNKPCSEETKIKISMANKGSNNGMYGKSGEQSPSFGSIRSEESKQKMAESQRLVWEKRRQGLLPPRSSDKRLAA